MTASGPPHIGPAEPAPISEPVRVDELLRALPEGEFFQLLREQVLAHSSVDPVKQWASSSSYLTYDKRTLTRTAMLEALDAAAAASRAVQRELFDTSREAMEALARRDWPATVRRLVELGEIFEQHERRQHARACYAKALEVSESLSESGPHLLALRRMGRLAQSVGDLDRAYNHYQVAYNLAVDARNLPEASAAATGLGNVKVDQGKWEKAELHYTSARVHAQEAGDALRMGQLWNNLSVVRRRKGDLDGALAFSDQAIAVFERLENPGELARCYNNLGLIQVERQETTLALESYQKAIGLAKGAFVVAAVHGNLCELHIRQGQQLLAEEEARLAEEIALRNGFNLILIHVYRLLGTLARLRLDANGITFFEKALEIADRHTYLHAQAEVHAEYGLFRQALGDAEEAVGHFQKALTLYRHLDARSEVKRVEGFLQASRPALGLGA